MAGASNPPKILILKEDIIISGVKEITNINFTITDIKKPTPEKLQMVYTGFATSILDVSDAQMSQMPLHLLETASSQELCNEEATAVLLFTRSLGYIFTAALVNDFSISDILSPTPKRTRYLLSALVNFSQFLISHEEDRINGLAKVESFMKANQSFLVKRERLTERINVLKQRKIENKEKIQQMNLNALRIKQQTLASHLEKRRAEERKEDDDREELHNIKIITKSTILLQQGKDTVEERRMLAHNLEVKANMLMAISDFGPSALKLVEKTADDVLIYETGCKAHEEIRDTSTETNMKLKDCLAQIQNIKRAMNSLTEKKQRRTTKYNQKMEIHKQIEGKFEKDQVDMLVKIEHNHNMVNKYNKELKQISELNLLEKKQHKQNMDAMKSAYNKLQTNLSVYNDGITTHCQQVTFDLQKLNTSA